MKKKITHQIVATKLVVQMYKHISAHDCYPLKLWRYFFIAHKKAATFAATKKRKMNNFYTTGNPANMWW